MTLFVNFKLVIHYIKEKNRKGQKEVETIDMVKQIEKGVLKPHKKEKMFCKKITLSGGQLGLRKANILVNHYGQIISSTFTLKKEQ